jgi:hypothetical protein
VLGKHHRDRCAVRRKGRCDLGADEAAADHREARAVVGQRPHTVVVVERSQVDDVVATERKPPRPAPRREQQPLVAVHLARVVGRPARVEVERHDLPAQLELHAEIGRVQPDRLLRASGPERLREGRALVRRVTVLAHEPDDAVGVEAADPLAGRVSGHASSDDQVALVLHDLPPGQLGRGCARRAASR